MESKAKEVLTELIALAFICGYKDALEALEKNDDSKFFTNKVNFEMNLKKRIKDKDVRGFSLMAYIAGFKTIKKFENFETAKKYESRYLDEFLSGVNDGFLARMNSDR